MRPPQQVRHGQDTAECEPRRGGAAPGLGTEFDIEANAGPDEPTRVHRRCVYLSGHPEFPQGNVVLREGVLEVRGGAPALRERLWLVPCHCDPTCNLYDWIVAFRGDRVEDVWPVSARGAGG